MSIAQPTLKNFSFAIDSSRSELRDFLKLMKPGVMSLVVFTGFCGALLAPGTLHPFQIIVAVLSIALASGASAAINMWYDRDIDALMKRTSTRPIPQGKIAPADALIFGVVLSCTSVIMLMFATNWVAGSLLLMSIFFYVFIYTMWLKRTSVQNIVIGGASGAFPPMIGWAAVTGNITIESCFLFLIIFLWTPPHFWALAVHQESEYRRAQIPMLPVIKGAAETYRQIMIYTLLMVISTIIPYAGFHFFGWIYGLSAILLGLLFIVGAIEVLRTHDLKKSMKLFWYSIFYLFALFTAMVVDHSFLATAASR